MNTQRFLVAVAVAFVFTFLCDFLIHAIWLDPDYRATSEVWRSEPQMQARFSWMVLAHVLMALAWVVLWVKGAWRGGLLSGAVFGFWMGVFQHVIVVFVYVTVPMRGDIAAKWIGAGMVQAVLLGVIVAALYNTAVRGTHRTV
ncbi:hypothetical protein BH20VER1_BH20VER1_02910 [soil metagenome]